VRAGTVRDAILFSLGANRAHGLRVTNADKRKAVGAMLADAEWSAWSDRKIADACGVSQPFVSGMRKPPEVITVITPPAAPKPAKVVTVTTPEPAAHTPPPAADTPAEPESFGPSAEELEEAQRAQAAEEEALRKLLEADDKLAHLAAENTKLRALNRILEERVNGLMNEKNEVVRLLKTARRKLEKFERSGVPA
jgi:hypothetical protein